ATLRHDRRGLRTAPSRGTAAGPGSPNAGGLAPGTSRRNSRQSGSGRRVRRGRPPRRTGGQASGRSLALAEEPHRGGGAFLKSSPPGVTTSGSPGYYAACTGHPAFGGGRVVPPPWPAARRSAGPRTVPGALRGGASITPAGGDHPLSSAALPHAPVHGAALSSRRGLSRARPTAALE